MQKYSDTCGNNTINLPTSLAISFLPAPLHQSTFSDALMLLSLVTKCVFESAIANNYFCDRW